MKLKCIRKDCLHEWTYKGKKKYPAMVTCPNCGNKARLQKEAKDE